MKVVVISERVLGFDHPNTIQQYVSYIIYGNTHLKCIQKALCCMCMQYGKGMISHKTAFVLPLGFVGSVRVCWRRDCFGLAVSV